MPAEPRSLKWLERIHDVSHRLLALPDLDELLPYILDAAVAVTEAERGFLVKVDERREEDRVRRDIDVVAARGFAREALAGASGNVSRTVVERVLGEGRGLVTSSEEGRELLDVPSVQDRHVLSIISVPLQLRGRLFGVLYLDHRFRPDAFSSDDLPILSTFAAQAALALETAELHAEKDSALRELEALRRGQALRSQQGEPVPLPTPAPRGFGELIGTSEVMQALYEEVERAARSGAPLLLLGESGAGKDAVAHEIHRRGREGFPFLRVNCGGQSDSLFATELFGHERGSFTGAHRARRGLFLQAERGSLVFDEVAELSPGIQARLLQVIEEGELRPIGSERATPFGCRVVATSQHDLRTLVDSGRFRRDLYFRLDVLRIVVPPLRERLDDLDALLAHFLSLEGCGHTLTAKARERLHAYAWPGNVRELRNEARRLATIRGPQVTLPDLSPEIRACEGLSQAPLQTGRTMADIEREAAVAALREAGGNKALAARKLGVPKTTFYRLIARHGLR